MQFINPAGLTVLGHDHPSELLERISHPTIHYKRPDGLVYSIATLRRGSPLSRACPERPRVTARSIITVLGR